MANPSSTTSPNLGLTLFYEGVKIDNDTINNNWLKIDSAIGGSNMYEKLVGTTGAFRSNANTTINYPTTNFDFMVIKPFFIKGYGSNSTGTNAISYGAGEMAKDIRIPKPTSSVSYNIPYAYVNDNTVYTSSVPMTFSTTGITTSNYSGTAYTYFVIEYYKYSTN